MKSEKGLTMIALIIIVLIVTILAIIVVKYTKEYIRKEKNEDIKNYMLLIQGKITEIANKHEVSEENNLIGIPLYSSKEDSDNDEDNNEKVEEENEDDNDETIKTIQNDIEYKIPDELKTYFEKLEDANLYILTQEDLNNLSINGVTVNYDEFYIVDYNSGDVFYSKGLDGKYSLLEIENKKEKIT